MRTFPVKVKFPKHRLLRAMSAWPPFLGAGIKVNNIAGDFKVVDVEMRLRFWNQNYVGVHYGGSLYSMTDPFYMLMLTEFLGHDYVVWDKAATIRFKRPGRGKVKASFRLPDEALDKIREEVAREGRSVPTFTITIVDESGKLVAEVEKVLSVRLKSAERERAS